ncbi:MAG TPA: trypsin-like peptidase domain-containing protein [Gemmatimonadaceae bacterium]|nr:trypsin-like peptidase domain-containing protein [Gemmatimonadaceae bacterium]
MRNLAALALVVATAACDRASATPSRTDTAPASASPVSAPVQSRSTIDESRRTAITRAVERVAPTVVTVQTETRERVPLDIFEQMFGGRSGERMSAGLGSGFVLRANGIIVTNAHVVAGATSVSVAMRDGSVHDAKVVGVDQINDIAVLRTTAPNLPVAPLGDSRDVIVGEWAIAIGNPFGFVLGNAEPSVTAGVVSGTGRNLVARSAGGGTTYDMIQTDAAINPGNSGGPLVNASGEVIGMNTVIYTPSEGSVGLGFAVPINRVKHVAEDLLANGTVRQPWVGVQLQEPTSSNPREAISLGAVIANVVPGSPAADAGLQRGDTIVRAGDQTIRNRFAWESALLDLRVGERVPVQVKRRNRAIDVTLSVADRPEVTAPRVQVLRDIQLATLTPAIRAERSIRSERGAYVADISDDLAQRTGIQRGDVLFAINRTDITDAAGAARVLEDAAGRGAIRLWLERNGRRVYTDIAIR